MDLRVNYKQSEIGLIPEDWNIRRLQSITTQPATYGVVKAGVFQSRGIPMLRGGDIKASRVSRDLPLISAEKSAEYQRTVLKERDVVIALVGYPGEAAVVPSDLVGANISRAVGLICPSNVLDSSFLACYLNSPIGRSEFLKPGAGSAQMVVNLRDLNLLWVPLPPTKAEQEAIAKVLSDADALIESLEQLLAKKRMIKQGGMQELLTGRKRLTGFGEEWQATTFSTVVRHHSGNSTLIKGKLASAESSAPFRGFSASGQDVWCDHYEHEGEAIVVSAVGSRCGKAFLATGKWSAIANTHVVWPIHSKVDRRFLQLYINDEDFWLKSGSGQRFVLFKPSFAKSLLLPPLAEQMAIADVLSDMDAELSALEKKLTKARQLKQGMMRELLTGRIRLV